MKIIYSGSVVAPLITDKTRNYEKRMAEIRAEQMKQPMMGYKVEWTTVKGVNVQAISGMSNIVAVPTNGKRNSARFDIIDLEAGSLLCQLPKSKVYAWLTAKAASLEVPKVQVVY